MHKSGLGEHIFSSGTTEEHVDIMKTARIVMKRSTVLKHEYTLVQLIKLNKFHRISKAAADCSAELQSDWATELQLDLVELARSKMQEAPAAKPAAKAAKPKDKKGKKDKKEKDGQEGGEAVAAPEDKKKKKDKKKKDKKSK